MMVVPCANGTMKSYEENIWRNKHVKMRKRKGEVIATIVGLKEKVVVGMVMVNMNQHVTITGIAQKKKIQKSNLISPIDASDPELSKAAPESPEDIRIMFFFYYSSSFSSSLFVVLLFLVDFRCCLCLLLLLVLLLLLLLLLLLRCYG